MVEGQGVLLQGHGWRLRIRNSGIEEPPAAPPAAPNPPAPSGDARQMRTSSAMKLIFFSALTTSIVLGNHYAQSSPAVAQSASGKAADVPLRIPRNVLEAEGFNHRQAKARWQKTLGWRREMGCDDILKQGHRYFYVVKKYYPHSLHLKDKDGMVTYWERPGEVDVRNLKRHGVNSDKLFWHYMWHTEYTWSQVLPEDGAKVTVVQDYGAFTPEKLSLEVINFVKRAVAMTSDHHPERAHKILVVNVPEWYQSIYSVLRRFMSKKMQKRITIFTAKQVQNGALLKHIAAHNLPLAYGGKSKLPLGEAREEKRMRQFVDRANRAAGVNAVKV